ncbi:MAG: STAS domain-containing protein [Anaerolineae bacterium]
MDYKIRTEGPISVLELSGDLDVSGAPALQAALQQVMDDGGRLIVVDLENVPFMDSSGLGVFVAAYRRLTAQEGQIALANTPPTLQKVFKLTRTDRLFTLYNSVSAAVEEMRDAGCGMRDV